ncbi:hypothetical protein ACIF6L_05325 [Kitasatospora sp. NPDC086009]|uniref:hypothetical protein n=1 Tax=unclassified Kitasatospora TaxID=2633591 RepID=UPI0037C7758D
MSSTARVSRSRRTAAVAATLAVVALGGSLALPTQAFADEVKGAKLSVQAPASVGFAGQPVAFTETITNTGEKTTDFLLELGTTSDLGTPSDAITIDYRNPTTGSWESVPLSFQSGPGSASYEGSVPGITVAAGRTVTVDLRIGAPMGLPHHGATNGGFDSIGLRSVVTAPGGWVTLAEQTRTIGVDSIRTSLASVPDTAVAGGAPIEFDAVLTNATASGYVNLGNVLFSDPHATVQIRKADGTWDTLAKVTGGVGDELSGVYLQGRNSGIAAGRTETTRVRVAYDVNTPLGATRLSPCLFVNEGDAPFEGTTMCETGSTVTVLAPAPTPTAAPTTAKPAAAKPATRKPTAPAAVKPAAEVKPAAAPAAPAPAAAPAVAAPAPQAAAPAAAAPAAQTTGELAATGSGSGTAPAIAAAVLATLGAGAVLLGRRLRRRS